MSFRHSLDFIDIIFDSQTHEYSFVIHKPITSSAPDIYVCKIPSKIMDQLLHKDLPDCLEARGKLTMDILKREGFIFYSSLLLEQDLKFNTKYTKLFLQGKVYNNGRARIGLVAQCYDPVSKEYKYNDNVAILTQKDWYKLNLLCTKIA